MADCQLLDEYIHLLDYSGLEDPHGAIVEGRANQSSSLAMHAPIYGAPDVVYAIVRVVGEINYGLRYSIVVIDILLI